MQAWSLIGAAETSQQQGRTKLALQATGQSCLRARIYINRLRKLIALEIAAMRINGDLSRLAVLHAAEAGPEPRAGAAAHP